MSRRGGGSARGKQGHEEHWSTGSITHSTAGLPKEPIAWLGDGPRVYRTGRRCRACQYICVHLAFPPEAERAGGEGEGGIARSGYVAGL